MQVMKILMVCLGNICRSPLAEGILKHKIKAAGLGWTVESAGTNGLHDGEAPHRLSQKVAKMNGIDICDQRSRRLTAADFHKYDMLYALAADVVDEMKWIAGKDYNPAKVDLLMNLVYPGRNMDVPDPWYGGEEGYHRVYKLIEEACNQLIVKHKSVQTRPALK
jgi:protein-tyrosine phosphatase